MLQEWKLGINQNVGQQGLVYRRWSLHPVKATRDPMQISGLLCFSHLLCPVSSCCLSCTTLCSLGSAGFPFLVPSLDLNLRWKAWEKVGLMSCSFLFSSAAYFAEPVGILSSCQVSGRSMWATHLTLCTGSRRFYS